MIRDCNCIKTYLTLIRVDKNLTYKEETFTINLNPNKTLYIHNLNKENIIVDNKIYDLEITVAYLGQKPTINVYDEHYCVESFCYNNTREYLDIYSEENILFYINLILKDFKNKNIRYYIDIDIESYKIKEIRISEKNLSKINYN